MFMDKRLFPVVLLLGLASSPARADFEGTLEMKMTLAGEDGSIMGGGTMNLSIAKTGSRMEMNMEKPMPMKMVVITRTDTPDKVYQVNDQGRTYSEIDVSKDNKPRQSNDNEPWKVKKLGEEKVLNYKTQHVMVTHGPETWELWTSKDLIDYETYRKLQASKGRMAGDERMVTALKEADADGMPLKAIVSQEKIKSTIELVKAEKKTLPVSSFEVPPGYKKTAGGFPGFGAGAGAPQDPRADEARKKLDDALKNMTPEQREAFERAMKQRQGNQP
jgi:hypothetical protein